MTNEAKARQKAIAAINEFERAQRAKGLSHSKRWLLDQFQKKKHDIAVGAAWLAIQKHLKFKGDDQGVIEGIVASWCHARSASATRDSWQKRAIDFDKARQALNVLQQFRGGYPSLFCGILNIEPRERLESSLSWLHELLNVHTAHHDSYERRTITRAADSPAGQRVMFAACMVGVLMGLFGRPCYSAVAYLTEIAFDTDFSVEQVRDAWRDHGVPRLPLPLPELVQRQIKVQLPTRRR